MISNYLSKLALTVLISTSTFCLIGQNNTRINTKEKIGWYNIFSTVKFNNKVGAHAEYQWRRTQFIDEWQQSLSRFGVNYTLNSNLQFRLGYAWIETFAYGEYPINSFGKNFTEHRSFQMIQQNTSEGIFRISHRFMLEQRFVGRYTNPVLNMEDQYLFSNRARYMFRVQMPLKGKTIQPKIPYIAVYDEIFIAFGENVNENVFDQNRFGVLLGYGFTEKIRVEMGYLNQILQLGREIDNRNVLQRNSGLIVNTLINFDLSKNSDK